MKRVKVKRVVPGPVCREPERAPRRRLSRAERLALKKRQGVLFEGLQDDAARRE